MNKMVCEKRVQNSGDILIYDIVPKEEEELYRAKNENE